MAVSATSGRLPRIPAGQAVVRADRHGGGQREVGTWDQHVAGAHRELKGGNYAGASEQVLDARAVVDADHRVVRSRRKQAHMVLGNLAKDVRAQRTTDGDSLQAGFDRALAVLGGGRSPSDGFDTARRTASRNNQIAQRLQIAGPGGGFSLRRNA